MKEIVLKVSAKNEEIAGDIMKCLANYDCQYNIVKEDVSKNYTYMIKDIPYTRLGDVNTRTNRQYRKDMDFYKSVGNILLSFGIKSTQLGFKYIIESIRLINIYGLNNYSLSEDVYPVISKWYDVSSSSVEHNIRNSIDSSWSRYVQGEQIKCGMSCFLKRPTNLKFLDHIAKISAYLVADSY